MITVSKGMLAFAAVPKAGCSSVKAMLAAVDPEKELPQGDDIPNSAFHELYPTRRFRKARFDSLSGHFRFTVIRDPVKRLMSVYTNRVAGLGDLHRSQKLKRRNVLPLDPDPDTFFVNIDRYARLSSIVRHHVRPISLFTGRDLGIYEAVYRTDQMDEVATMISDRSEIRVSAARANKSEMKLDLGDLKPETRDAVRRFLEEEYTYLSPYFENPFD